MTYPACHVLLEFNVSQFYFDNPVIILNYLKKDRFWDSGTDLSSRK